MTSEATDEMSLPLSGVGIGLRNIHLKQVVEARPTMDWFEVHAENFFAGGSAACHLLDEVRKNYPLSAHCVGLSLGSEDALDPEHLAQLKAFIARYQPAIISDHLSWSGVGAVHTPDLLPLPYTKAMLAHFCNKVDALQSAIQREILIENPSSYLTFKDDEIPEWEFLRQVAARTGCGILLDVNNIRVNCHNHGFDAAEYLKAIPVQYVKEMHLAGYAERSVEGGVLLVDEHGAPVFPEVWSLYAEAVKRFGEIPTLIEWDNHIPALDTLLAEAKKARQVQSEALKVRAA